MEQSSFFPAVLACAALAAFCAPIEAQTAPDASVPQPRHVRKAAPRPMPFSPDSEKQGPRAAIEFRPFDRMSHQDRDLAADAESTIGEKAGLAGLEFNAGKWNYQQIVCAALPDHLLLQFTRNEGKGDVSVFSASIPRSGHGRVRVIPILRRGYSLFSPAPINALTLSAFNQIRSEERFEQPPAWLDTGLCYAALAGAHPLVGPAEETDPKKAPSAPPGRLMIPVQGGAVISFTDAAAIPRPIQWTMTFNGKGKLLKATHTVAPRSAEAVSHKPGEAQGKPASAADPSSNTILIK